MSTVCRVVARVAFALLLGLPGQACTSGNASSTRRTFATTPEALDFGSVPGGTTVSQQIKIANTGHAALAIQSLRVVDDPDGYFEVTTAPKTLSPGGSLTVSVAFSAPMSAGAYGASLEIDSDSTDAPQVLVPLAAIVPSSCANTTCPPNATCTDADAGPACACVAGYVMEGGVCVSLCANNGGCDPNATCTPDGMTVDCTCAPGFQGNGMTGTALVCVSKDPCRTNNGGCDPHASCSSSGTVVSCSCNPGYQGNGAMGTELVCSPTNQCLTNNGGCDSNALCTPDGLNVTCTCLTGFHGNGQTGTALVCTPIDACAVDNGGCDPNAACAPVAGSATDVDCTCNPGYSGNGLTGPALVCTQINQCTINNGGCDPNATCLSENIPGGMRFVCVCDLGYTGDGLQCFPAQAGHPSTIGGHVCDIDSHGSLWCWGLNASGQVGNATHQPGQSVPYAQFTPWEVDPGAEWLDVSAGHAHTCGVWTNGSLWCWGDNSAGECGNGAVSSPTPTETQLIAAAIPQRVDSGTSWRLVSAGWSSTCALQLDGSLWCWGDNTHGQAGKPGGGVVSRPSPIVAAGGNSWTTVSCGHGFACGLQSDQSLWCWGEGASGQLGGGAMADSSMPVRVGMDQYTAVAAGDRDACAVRTDGTLWCWGWGPDLINTFSPGGATMTALTPIQIGTGTNWTAVSVNDNACAIQNDGSLWCSGPNLFGNLGTGDQVKRGALTRIGTASQTWQAVSVGASTCAEGGDGHAYCWGSDDLGGVGDGAPAASAPTQVMSGSAWKSVALGAVRPETLAAGWPAGYGVQSDGTLWEWGGYAPFGAPQLWTQLPTQIGNLNTWTSVVAGDPDACALDSSGQLACFGTTALGDGSDAPSAMPVAVGSGAWLPEGGVGDLNSCWLDPMKVLSCWGHNQDGELGNGTMTASLLPVVLTDTWSDVSVGAAHACGILLGGTLSCWGSNAGGQLGTGSTMDSTTPVPVSGSAWSAVAAGFSHTCGLQATHGDALLCWGQNSAGEVGNRSTTMATLPTQIAGEWSSIAVSIDSATTCGIQSLDGSLWCWGSLDPIVPGIQTTPYQLDASSTWSDVVVSGIAPGADGIASDVTVCARKATDHSLWCWGDNLFGQRGNGDAWRSLPVALPF